MKGWVDGRRALALLSASALAILLFGGFSPAHGIDRIWQLAPLDMQALYQLHNRFLGSTVASVYLSPYFWVLVAGVLVLERVIPANATQRVFSVGFYQDAIYFVLTTAFRVTLLSIYIDILRATYDRYLSFLTITSVSMWPDPARGVTAILLSDFLAWFHHVVLHKVPLFWYFHAIHHSQRELNLFTDYRYHPVEYLITKTIKIIPLLMLGASFPLIVTYVFFQEWYTKFFHGNVRTNLGILRYLLVTPQSHRIHHSIDARHHDNNFGVILSVWDHLFKTQWRGYDEYPETGLPNRGLPHETTVKGLSLLSVPIAQFAYPFRVIRQRWTDRHARAMSRYG